jgi:hypothetical protein
MSGRSVLSDFSLITGLVRASTTYTNVITTELLGRRHRCTFYTDNDKLGPYYCYYTLPPAGYFVKIPAPYRKKV